MELMQVTLSVDLPNLGGRLKQARENKGLPPTQVAALAGMSVANLYRIEGGEAKSIPRETLKRLSEVLGVDFDAEVRAVMLKQGKQK